MQTHSLIRIEQVCTHYRVEEPFLTALHELGLIQLIVEQNDRYVVRDELKMLESMIYFNKELQINIEGIDAIAHLLRQIRELQDELNIVKKKLSLFTGE